jgi:hypothetical protein
MTLEEALMLVFNEYGLLIAFSIACIVTLWRRLNIVEDKFAETLKGNTEVLTKLLERLENHD